MATKQELSDMQDLLKIQLSDGNWDCDSYMHGMANGMIIMYGIAAGEQPEFKTAPQFWRRRSYRIFRRLTCNQARYRYLQICASLVIALMGITIEIKDDIYITENTN